MTRLIIFIVSGMLWVSASLAGELITCFTPGEKCTDLIVKQIDEAKKSIYVQAYGFTSPPIKEA
jgi:phosphatidylserine/phosphatidylglycerophosphate/cardiolipin synthase-like enzyme